MRNSKREEKGAIDEVEELLRAAQDDVLLKLSLNSHIARSSSSDLHPDLSRRFTALKSPPSAPVAAPSHPPPPPPASASAPASASSPSPRQVDDELKAVLGDDLSARFAALRGSLYSSSPSSSSTSSAAAAGAVGPSAAADGRDRRENGGLKSGGEDDDLKEEDEVEKLIQWAVDAARLDPSPPSDDDDGPNDIDDSDDDDDDDDSDDEREQKKNKQKSK